MSARVKTWVKRGAVLPDADRPRLGLGDLLLELRESSMVDTELPVSSERLT